MFLFLGYVVVSGPCGAVGLPSLEHFLSVSGWSGAAPALHVNGLHVFGWLG